MNNLEELKQELKKLENKINELENKGNNNYKRPRYKDYYCLIDTGGIAYVKNQNDEIDDFRFKIGNYFKIEESIENHKEKLLIEQELKDIARELNKGKEIDWKDDSKDKFCISYDFYESRITYNFNSSVKIQGIIYCLDKNFKDVAIERIGQERLTRYLKGELD
jgi:hypothetical protein